jgi:hypothetical protein
MEEMQLEHIAGLWRLFIDRNYQPKNYFQTTKINTKILKNYKQIRYQPTVEGKLTKYKTTNKSQPEPAQVGSPNPKSKIKYELMYFQKRYKKKANQFF